MAEGRDTLAELVEAIGEARAVLADLHGAVKDARRELRTIRDETATGAHVLVMHYLNQHLDKALETTARLHQQAVDESTQRFTNRLEKLVRELEVRVERAKN
jgi:hypothetical protein